MGKRGHASCTLMARGRQEGIVEYGSGAPLLSVVEDGGTQLRRSGRHMPFENGLDKPDYIVLLGFDNGFKSCLPYCFGC